MSLLAEMFCIESPNGGQEGRSVAGLSAEVVSATCTALASRGLLKRPDIIVKGKNSNLSLISFSSKTFLVSNRPTVTNLYCPEYEGRHKENNFRQCKGFKKWLNSDKSRMNFLNKN